MALGIESSASVFGSSFHTPFSKPSALVGSHDGAGRGTSGSGSLRSSPDQVTISDRGRKALGLLDQVQKSGTGLGRELTEPLPLYKTLSNAINPENNLGIGPTKVTFRDFFYKKSLQMLVNTEDRPGKLNVTV